MIIRDPAKGWGVSLGASNRERAYVQSGLCTDSSSSNPFYPIIYGITANANPISLLLREWVSAQKGWEKEGVVAKMLTDKKGWGQYLRSRGQTKITKNFCIVKDKRVKNELGYD